MSNPGPASALQVLKFQAGAAARGLAALFGQDCALCSGPSEELVCAACDRLLPRIGCGCARCSIPLARPGTCAGCLRAAPAFEAAVAAFEYRFPVDRLVQRFKYGGDLALGRWLAESLRPRLRAAPLPEVILAAPLGAARLRERGFNQAAEVAKVLARGLDVPLAIDGLRKLRDTPPQQALSRRQRHANLHGAFECRVPLAGRRAAIVDDVMTTGATAQALARAAKAAGAAHVTLWVLGRTP